MAYDLLSDLLCVMEFVYALLSEATLGTLIFLVIVLYVPGKHFIARYSHLDLSAKALSAVAFFWFSLRQFLEQPAAGGYFTILARATLVAALVYTVAWNILPIAAAVSDCFGRRYDRFRRWLWNLRRNVSGVWQVLAARREERRRRRALAQLPSRQESLTMGLDEAREELQLQLKLVDEAGLDDIEQEMVRMEVKQRYLKRLKGLLG